MATIEIPVSDDGENWMNEVRRQKGKPKDGATAAVLARKLAERLEQSPDPKAPSRPAQGRQTVTPTNSRPTRTSPISGASLEQLALTLLGPSDGRQR